MNAHLYLFRHGHIDAGNIIVGQRDAPLSPLGKRQAAYWRDELAQVPFTAAWSSPLARSRETAAILLGERQKACPMTVVEELREVSLGRWEGRTKAWVREHDAAAWEQRGQSLFTCPPPGGESLQTLAERVLPAFLAICATAQGHQASLLVAHRSVNQVILAHMLALPSAHMIDIPQPYGALTRLELARAVWEGLAL